MRTVKCFVVLLLVAMIPSALAAQWNYSGLKGPRNWGSITPGFSACSKGQEQSPIDLRKASPLKDDHFSLHYHAAAFNLWESPHNLYQESVKPAKNYVAYNGQRYNLLQVHFHVPSEHRLDGKQYPMEVHLVHQNSKKELLVLGIFLERGASNTYLNALLNSPQLRSLSEEVEQPVELNPVMLNPSDLAGRAKDYYVYQGSLTTPPCSEGVTWVVAKEPMQVSAQQLSSFKSQVTSYNSRPLQKLNGREVGFED